MAVDPTLNRLKKTGHLSESYWILHQVCYRELVILDDLFTKAQLYIDRGYRNLEDHSTFAHWNLLALELLARSAIASIHPVLVANPNDVKSLYYAVGRKDLCEFPRSIPARNII